MPSAKWVLLFMLMDVALNIDESPLLTAGTATALIPVAMIEVGSWNERRKQAIAAQRASADSPRSIAAASRPSAQSAEIDPVTAWSQRLS